MKELKGVGKCSQLSIKNSRELGNVLNFQSKNLGLKGLDDIKLVLE
jgi:hypothetical protein